MYYRIITTLLQQHVCCVLTYFRDVLEFSNTLQEYISACCFVLFLLVATHRTPAVGYGRYPEHGPMYYPSHLK